MMICILNENNQIINIVDEEYPIENNERLFYPWNHLWKQYTDIEPFEYTKNRYINAAGVEFAKRRDAIRWIQTSNGTYGFDVGTEDITNFMAAYTPVILNQQWTTQYKVWVDESTKSIKVFNYADMTKVYETVRKSQFEAYAWYEEIKAKLMLVTEQEGKEKLKEIYDQGVS